LQNKNEFYNLFTASSSKFITPQTQSLFRESSILIAGLGSIGNPIAMAAIRAGAENLTITDPDVVNIENLPRQHYTIQQVGINKALATKNNASLINPFASIKAVIDGTTKENVQDQVDKAKIIIDAIDIRSLGEIWELHNYASILNKPVITGYDLAGTAMLEVYRYDEDEIPALRGELTLEKIKEFRFVEKALISNEISESEFLNYIYDTFTGPINPLLVPVEQLIELSNRKAEDCRTYQLGTTSTALSALVVETILSLLANKITKKTIYVDLPSLVRRKNPNIFLRIFLLMRVLKKLNDRSKVVDEILTKLNH